MGPRPSPVSIVIGNHDYARYVGAAIESALAQSHGSTEVVVVDDGSTDESRAVIDRYADRVAIVHKENGGQGSVYNTGFEHCSGDIVLFLDSDDLLDPDAVRRVVAVFEPGVAKAQFRLRVIDADDVVRGEYPPADVPLAEGDVVPSLLERGFYSTAVGSGSAYARGVLERLLPMPEEDFTRAADGYLAVAAPFEGEVRSIAETLGSYRIHGANDSGGTADAAYFRKTLRYQLNERRVVADAARRRGLAVEGDPVLRNAGHLERRLASLRLDPAGHPVEGDRRLVLAARGIAAELLHADASLVRRALDCIWFVAVALLPRPAAAAVIRWKYERAARPAAVTGAARALRRLAGRG